MIFSGFLDCKLLNQFSDLTICSPKYSSRNSSSCSGSESIEGRIVGIGCSDCQSLKIIFCTGATEVVLVVMKQAKNLDTKQYVLRVGGCGCELLVELV